ncbi:flagellar protein FlaG [Litchfieldia alkalitelluris]|uniref:flagellar protein FlaG n=1 Tax=Litchfieldia alkalitelluris TaxID=304268 RepID=UPI0009975379|nr:flagellar protein FlaG [Litchfieldia alkalitelluris]
MSVNQVSGNGVVSNSYEMSKVESTNKKTDIAKEFLSQIQTQQPNETTSISKTELEDVVTNMNKFLSISHTSLKFQLHDELNEYYVTVVDDKTQEVVREIPSKKILDIYAAMTEFVGVAVDKKI